MLDETTQLTSTLNLTKAQKWIAATLALVGTIFCGMLYAIQAPFYPQEANAKNVTASEYGFVFASFELSGMIMSLVGGVYTPSVGPKKMLMLSYVLMIIPTVIFGTLTYFKDKISFYSVSVLCRVVEGAGRISFSSSVLTILMTLFPEHIAFMMAMLETTFGVGGILGPALGGMLFDLGGFILPFMTIAIVLLLSLPFSVFFIPNDKCLKKVQIEKKPIPLKRVLAVPQVYFCITTITVAACLTGFFNATLEPHIRPFGLSGTYIGLIFMIQGFTYGLSSPLWGWCCDKGMSPLLCMFLGSILNVVGLSMIGPLPFLDEEPSITLVCLGLFFSGCGMGGQVAPSTLYTRISLIIEGFPEDITLNSIVSCVLMFSWCLGCFISPLIGGPLLDAIGFRDAELPYIVFNMMTLVVSICIYFA